MWISTPKKKLTFSKKELAFFPFVHFSQNMFVTYVSLAGTPVLADRESPLMLSLYKKGDRPKTVPCFVFI